MIENAEILEGFLDGIRPAERLSVSEWSDKYRFLSSASSAEPGRWRTSRVPYLKEVLDRFSPYDECTEVSIMKGAQLGFTEAGFNILGFFIHLDPCPIMYLMPTLDTIRRNSKMRISPMIASTPELAKRITVSRKKDSGNSMFQKDFPGGTLILAGANSGSSLRSVPIKCLILDEVDAYPLDLDKEGSPVDLAKARTRTFAKKKIMYFSTPINHGTSVIEGKFLDSSQRRFFVPCPHCDHYQDLRWEQLKYKTDEAKKNVLSAHYECEECEFPIEEHEKTELLAAGEWRDTVPENIDPKRYGYHINSLYSPLGWYSWKDAAEDWIKAQKSQEKLKVFTNTVLGETWLEKGEVPDWENLYNRRKTYETNVPWNDVCLITAGVDIQKDRIELELVGWMKGHKTQSLDYRVIPGNTSEIGVWNELAKVVSETWTRKDGAIIPLYKMAIDTGYRTSEVYKFCRRFHPKQVVPIKGQDKQPVIIAQSRPVDDRKKSTRKHALKTLVLHNVGVSILKSELYGWLKLKIHEDGVVPDGYCFFPTVYDQHYFKMLTAEKLVKRLVKGYNRYEWEKTRERNEGLDCRIYARAAAAICGIDRWKEADWIAVLNTYGQKKSQPAKKKRSSGFW